MSIELRICAPRPAYVAGEDIVFGIEIENRGASPVQVPDPESNANWQPAYELHGPGPDDVARFDFRTIVRGKSPVSPAPADASLLSIGPGETVSASLFLSGLVRVRRPGTYTLTARLSWDGIDVTSPPVSFTLEPLAVSAFGTGMSRRRDGTPEIYAAWIHEREGRTALFQALFGEDRPDLGEMGRRTVARLCEPAPGSSDVFVPWGAHSRLEDLIGWVLWREGQDLCGLPTMGRGPLRMTLPFVPSSWAFPALESRAHDIDLFVIGGPAARTLAMVRIVHGGFARAPQGSVQWTVELPEAIVGAAVGAQPNAHEKLRHLALVSSGAERVTVRHVLVDGVTPPGKFNEVEIDEWTAAAAAPPAVLAHDKGGARVSVLVSSPKDPARCRLIELLFGPPHPSEPGAAASSIVLPVPPAEAQVRYFRHAVSGVFRRDWAIRGTDGATYARGPGGGVRAVRAPSDDPAPLALIVLATNSYLLDRSPSGGFDFEHV
jgi:hypothetical protein